MTTPAESRAARHLVAANRILANEGVIDAYGHASVRHPDRADRFLLSRSKSPQFVDLDDVREYTLDGEPLADDGARPYLERFIHARIYAARPDVHAIVHAHTESVLPFTITDVALTAVVQSASDIGLVVPRWDIRARFGDQTNILVTDVAKAEDLARALEGNTVVLMRGHGFAAVGSSLPGVVRTVVYLGQNARVQTIAASMGAVVALSPGEIEAQQNNPGTGTDSPGVLRSWEYFAERAGCTELITDERG